MNIRSLFTFVAFYLLTTSLLCGQKVAGVKSIDADDHRLVSYPGAWAFQLGDAGIILVRDEELNTLAHNPDKKINLSIDKTPHLESLREICEQAQQRGQKTLTIAFDQFFAQYREGQDTPRRLRPDSDEYIHLISLISNFASQYGLGLQLSLLSPLELGDDEYRRKTGDIAEWMHYREGFRDPETGTFSVQLWQNRHWTNNKGTFNIEDGGVRVFAFHEEAGANGLYRVVDPSQIVEIKSGVQVERLQNDSTLADENGFSAVRIRVFGKVPLNHPALNRVLVVQIYKTPEMDYFSPKSLPYLKSLIDRYESAGIKLNKLYSDEMHIQQDWNYFGHLDHGEFAMRYVSPWLARTYAEKYGKQYEDFAKYMVYFVHGQEDVANDLSAKQDITYVFGPTPEEIQKTALFRARYYKMLQDGVVDLFVQAKKYAENTMGHPLMARAHATWAESPTIDYWRSSAWTTGKAQYEYTSDFVWSNTVQQAAAACYDYFKWGDFLTGNGNDDAEGGWIDRDYYGLAIAASTGILNEVPNSYAAHWGVPDAIGERRSALEDVYGDGATPPFAAVENMQHRETGVLMLYPLDLVAIDERFGSWMIQYGYADYVTAAKLLERGKVTDGAIELAGRRFTTLVATFEPFPSVRLLEMMKRFTESGGRLIWLGPPPLLTSEGDSARQVWEEIFGANPLLLPEAEMTWQQVPENTRKAQEGFGLMAPGSVVRFEGALEKVQPQQLLTDFLVDHIYPVTTRPGTEIVARVKSYVVGTKRGNAIFLGYRPRDDQSGSLGYDERNWFDVLNALGSYPPTGKFAGINDNADYVSRIGSYMATAFPNGAIAIAPHLRNIEEVWKGDFVRNHELDQQYFSAFPLPSNEIKLSNFQIRGHSVTYRGNYAVAFRLNNADDLIAFSGRRSQQITIDGKKFTFADSPLNELAWAPVESERRVDPDVRLQILVNGEGTVRIPVTWKPADLHLYCEGSTPGSRGQAVASNLVNGMLVFKATKENSGRWIYGLITAASTSVNTKYSRGRTPNIQ